MPGSNDPTNHPSMDPGGTGGNDTAANVFEGGVQVGTQARQLDFDATAFNVTEDIANSQADIAINFGTTAGTVCQGNDSRLSDARTPLAHTHVKADITDFAHDHTAAEIVSGVLAIGRIPTGTTASTVCIGNDSRLSNKRAPTISGESINDIMYFDGSNWVRIATTAGFLKGGSTPAYTALTAGDIPTLTRAKISDFLPIIETDIQDEAVTFAKMQGINTGSLLGRTTPLFGPIENILIGSSLDITAGDLRRAALVGDVTAPVNSNTLTIALDAVTNTKLADMPANTIKGRNEITTGDPENLTTAEVTAMLDTFTSTTKGLAPASGGGTSNFLRADGTWASPGASSTDIKQTEIDFGLTPIRFKEFVITDAAISTSNQIIASVAYETTTGEPAGYTDQAEELTEEVSLSCKPGTGNFTLYAVSHHKVLHGKLKINYLVG